ncbi:MAG: hypothetical protein ACOVQE_01835, partial [Chitinophagaceae bacterium]
MQYPFNIFNFLHTNSSQINLVVRMHVLLCLLLVISFNIETFGAHKQISINQFTATISVSQPTCSNNTGSIVIENPIGNNFSYSINGGVSYQRSNQFTGLTVGNYRVVVKDDNGESSDTINVSLVIPTPPNAPTVTTIQPNCTIRTGSIIIQSPKGSQFQYLLNGLNAQRSDTFALLQPRNYTVLVYDTVTQCYSNATTATIQSAPARPSKPSLTVSQPDCGRSFGIVTVRNPVNALYAISTDSGLTYSAWQTSRVFSFLTADKTYTIHAQNSSTGCTSDTAMITVNKAPIQPENAPTVIVNDPKCNLNGLGSIEITTPTAGTGFEYTIDGGVTYQASPIFNNVSSNSSYSVSYRDVIGGCLSPDTLVTLNAPYNIPAKPIVSVIQPSCNNSKGSFTITSPIGFRYIVDSDTSSNRIYLQVNPKTNDSAFVVRTLATDTTNCASDTTIVILRKATPEKPSVIIQQPGCGELTGSLTVQNTEPFTLNYSVNNGINFQTSNNFSLTPGNYIIQNKNTVLNCLSDTLQVTIQPLLISPAVPSIKISPETCKSLGAIEINNNGDSLLYILNNSTIQDVKFFGALTAGNYSFRVQHKKDNCFSTDTVLVIPLINTLTTPQVTVNATNCTDSLGSFTISSPVGDSVFYRIINSNSNFSLEKDYKSLAIGRYQLVAKDSVSGCVSDSVEVVIPNPTTPTTPSFNITTINCLVNTASINIQSFNTNLLYSLDSLQFSSSKTFSNLKPGNYTLWARDSVTGCTNIGTNFIINPGTDNPVLPSFSVVPPADCSSNLFSVNFTPVIGLSYSINGGLSYQTENLFTNLPVGIYHLTVRNNDGCISTDSLLQLNLSNNAPILPSVTVLQPTECTVNTGSINFANISGLAYSIDGGLNYQTNPLFNNLPPG